jgi:hypothetical protein
MIESAARIDEEYLVQQKKTTKLLRSYGLDWKRPPDESFSISALQPSGIMLCRDVNAIRMARIMWCTIAKGYLNIVLYCSATKSQATKDAWAELEAFLEKTARFEADLILASIPFFLRDASFSTTSVFHLIWPLSTFGASMLLSPEQQACAQETLIQIGKRAKMPIATKLAEEHFHPHAELSKEAHMIHQTWHF